MKIQHVTIKGFRNVPEQDIDLNGHNVMLLGDNTVGKSNFIKALHSLLNAKFSKNSVATGSDRAEITAVLSEFDNWAPVEGTQHEFRAKIRRKANGDEEVKIELRYPDGGVETRLGDIRSFVGSVPLQFNFVELSRSEKGKQQQLDIIKSMLPVDYQEELRKLENRAKSAYDERTEVGRDLENIKGFINQSGLTEDDLKRYKDPTDSQQLRSQLTSAATHNQNIINVRKRIEERNTRTKQVNSEVERIDEQIKRLQDQKAELNNELAEMATKNDQANAWLKNPANVPQSTEAIEAQLTVADEHNRKHERVKMLQGKIDQRNELQEQYGSLTAQVDSTRAAIQQHIRELPSPVPGLTIDPDTGKLLYKDLEVDEEHMSTAQIMMLEVMLMMCKANQAQVIFIERGESLGSKMLNELKELADGSGFQLFMEKVQPGTEELIVEIESE